MTKLNIKRKAIQHVKKTAIFLSGMFIAISMVLAFSVETSMENVVQYIQQIIVTYDGGSNGDTLVDLNSDGTGTVYMKGNLGINTTTPSEKLEVNGNTLVNWSIEADRIRRSDTSSYLGLIGAQNDNDGAHIYLIGKDRNGSNAGNLELYYGGYTNTWSLVIIHQKDSWATSNVMVIDETEKVGIGTSSPKEKLEINGAILIGNTTTNNTWAIKYSGDNFYGYNWTTRLQLNN